MDEYARARERKCESYMCIHRYKKKNKNVYIVQGKAQRRRRQCETIFYLIQNLMPFCHHIHQLTNFFLFHLHKCVHTHDNYHRIALCCNRKRNSDNSSELSCQTSSIIVASNASLSISFLYMLLAYIFFSSFFGSKWHLLYSNILARRPPPPLNYFSLTFNYKFLNFFQQIF